MCKNKKQETKALRQGGKRLENHLDIVHQVLEQVNQVILGKREEIREVMLAFLAKGHVLLEDIPGVGKTTLAVAFSRTMLLDYKRVQYTGWNLSVPSLQTQSREETRDTQNRQSPGIFFEVDKRTVWKGILTGAGGIGILCLIFYRRWKRRDQWIQKGGMGRLFDQLLFDLHFSGRMKEYQGWEKDFAYRLAEEIPAVTLEETEQLLRGAREEAFGEPGKQKKEGFQAAWRSCLKVRVHLLSRMKRPVKLLYYIRVSFRWFSP